MRALLILVAACSVAIAVAETNLPPDARPSDIPGTFVPAAENWDFTKTEAMIPMRDGVKLYTVILAPKGRRASMPIMLTRTPYNAAKRAKRLASPHLASTLPVADELFAAAGYIRVFQDVRGKDRSEGQYVMTRPIRGALNATASDHSTDAWDTIDWLVRNVPNNNGRVGMIGPSYEGFLALAAMIDPHPALKVTVPVNPMVDGWKGDDWFHNGAFRQFNLDYIFRQTLSKESDQYPPYGFYDQYAFYLASGSSGEAGKRVGADQLPFWNLLGAHSAYDSFWSEQAVDAWLRARPSEVKTLIVHSLFDQEDLFGALSAYRALETRDVHNDRVFLTLGPWGHAQTTRNGATLGAIDWSSDTSKYFREQILQPFLDHILIGESVGRDPAPVTAFDTGTRVWRTYENWPRSCASGCASRSTSLFLKPGQALGFVRADAGAPFEEYVSDPAKPVPFRVRPILPIYAEGSTWKTWLADDQRPFSDRTDVLTYTSDVLAEPLTVSGSPLATIFASTTGSDTDWVVKLIDVYPEESPASPALGGYQLMIAGEIFRGRYRESFEKPKPVAANEILPYRIELPAVSHTFLPGHRIMVQIQSSWFPLYDRNPQQFVKNIFWARPEDYRKATQRVYQTRDTASVIELPLGSQSNLSPSAPQ